MSHYEHFANIPKDLLDDEAKRLVYSRETQLCVQIVDRLEKYSETTQDTETPATVFYRFAVSYPEVLQELLDLIDNN